MINDYEARHDITDENYATANETAISNDDVISTLNGLIETCKDGERGLLHAAELVTNPGLKTFFTATARRRAEIAAEIAASAAAPPAASAPPPRDALRGLGIGWPLTSMRSLSGSTQAGSAVTNRPLTLTRPPVTSGLAWLREV